MVTVSPPNVAQEVQSTLTRGGQRYDKRYKVIKDKAPEKAHPAYPKDKKYAKKPKPNWRSRECRGWIIWPRTVLDTMAPIATLPNKKL